MSVVRGQLLTAPISFMANYDRERQRLMKPIVLLRHVSSLTRTGDVSGLYCNCMTVLMVLFSGGCGELSATWGHSLLQ